MEPRPLFILWARSFWLGILPSVLAFLEFAIVALSDQANIGPIAAAISAVFGVDTDSVYQFMVTLVPLFSLIVAHQRRGQNRPYSLNPQDTD